MKHSRYLTTTRRNVSVIYLVAHAPHYNARMISVTANPRGNVFLVPFIKEPCIVKLGLWALPHIKSFTVNQYAHFIAKLHKSLCRRIVRSSYRIYTHIKHTLKLSSCRRLVESRTKTAKVMVQTDAVELDMPAIEIKTAVGLILNFTQSDLLCAAVDHLTVIFQVYR